MPEKEWTEMTPQEKREQRVKGWLDNWGNKFIDADAEKAYKTRVQRLIDVYNVREPDRVPVNLPVGNLPLTMFGVNARTAMYDYEKAIQATQKFNEKYSEELEYTAMPYLFAPGRVLDILDYKIYAWPGHGIPENGTGWQFIEGEYMKEDEYDDLIRDPSDFWMRTYLPRVFGVLEPMRMFQPFTNITENVHIGQFMPLAMPPVQEMLQKLLDVGKEYQKIMQLMMKASGGTMIDGLWRIYRWLCQSPLRYPRRYAPGHPGHYEGYVPPTRQAPGSPRRDSGFDHQYDFEVAQHR